MSHEKRLHDRPVALKQSFFEGNANDTDVREG